MTRPPAITPLTPSRSLLPNNFAYMAPEFQLLSDGSNYQTWVTNMSGLLLHYGVYDVVFGPESVPRDSTGTIIAARDRDRELSYRRALARRIIMSGLESQLRQCISSLAGIVEVPKLWKKLEEWYGSGT